MKDTYKYINNIFAKENDICFYSEDNGTDEWHYADSICLITKLEDKGTLYMKSFVITINDAVSFIDFNETFENMVELKYAADDFNKLTHLVKIGEYPKDKHMLTKEYANSYYCQKEMLKL